MSVIAHVCARWTCEWVCAILTTHLPRDYHGVAVKDEIKQNHKKKKKKSSFYVWGVVMVTRHLRSGGKNKGKIIQVCTWTRKRTINFEVMVKGWKAQNIFSCLIVTFFGGRGSLSCYVFKCNTKLLVIIHCMLNTIHLFFLLPRLHENSGFKNGNTVAYSAPKIRT